MTDRQLLQVYAGQRDARAFGVFVKRHEGSLLSFAAAVLRDRTLAQDVVQETFLRAARYPQRLLASDGGPGGERNWLLKVTRNLSADSLRRRASARRLAAVLATVAPSAAPAADEPLETREESACVNAAIGRLRPRLRELLVLKVREHKSYKEIAQITGLSVTNVGFLLHQAMVELKDELKPQMNADEGG